MPRYRQLRDVPRYARDVTPTQRILRAHGSHQDGLAVDICSRSQKQP